MPIKMNVRFQERKICVFTNYRTGSTFLNVRIAQLNNLAPLGEFFSYYADNTIHSNTDTFNIAYQDLISKPNFALKLMPDHLRYDPALIEKVLNQTDKIIYLYRKDFEAQARSYIAAGVTNTYAMTGSKEANQKPENSIIKVGSLSQETIETYINVLRNNYVIMSQFYKKYPGDLMCLENFELQKPHQKTIIWTDGPPTIPKFDVESLFH